MERRFENQVAIVTGAAGVQAAMAAMSAPAFSRSRAPIKARWLRS